MGCYVEKNNDKTLTTKLSEGDSVSRCATDACNNNMNTIGYMKNKVCYGGNDANYTKNGIQSDKSKCATSTTGGRTVNVKGDETMEVYKIDIAKCKTKPNQTSS